MNKRIMELMDQCEEPYSTPEVPCWDMEKFAELIVKECAGRIKLQQQMDEVTEAWVYTALQEDLREHFEVEE